VISASAHGVAVPGRVQVTGFDNIDFAGLGEPALTTVDQMPLAEREGAEVSGALGCGGAEVLSRC
jgi:LacI family transcriptional regulator